MVEDHGGNMFNAIIFALICFSIGLVTGVSLIISILLRGLKGIAPKINPPKFGGP